MARTERRSCKEKCHCRYARLASGSWLRGHAEGEGEREAAAATSGKRRRRANGPDQPAGNA
jgi:hypothetical protein